MKSLVALCALSALVFANEKSAARHEALDREVTHYLDERRHEVPEAGSESWFSLTTTVEIWSKYIFSIGTVGSDKPVIQTDWFVTLPKGFYADLWTSNGFDGDWSGGFDDEIDYTVGWTTTAFTVDLDIALTYWQLFDLGEGDGDALVPSVKLSRSFKLSEAHSITPYTKFETLFIHNDSASNGWTVYAGVTHEWTISDRWSLSQELSAAYDDGVFRGEAGAIGRYAAKLSYQCSEQLSVGLGLKLFVPIADFNDRETEIVFGLTASFKF